jgi:hypothetical protein
MESMDQLKAFLADQGYQVQPQPVREGGNLAGWIATKELSEFDGPPVLIVEPWVMQDASGDTFSSVSVSVNGQKNSIWIRNTAYGLHESQIAPNLNTIESTLITMWRADHADDAQQPW